MYVYVVYKQWPQVEAVCRITSHLLGDDSVSFTEPKAHI